MLLGHRRWRNKEAWETPSCIIIPYSRYLLLSCSLPPSTLPSSLYPSSCTILASSLVSPPLRPLGQNKNNCPKAPKAPSFCHRQILCIQCMHNVSKSGPRFPCGLFLCTPSHSLKARVQEIIQRLKNFRLRFSFWAHSARSPRVLNRKLAEFT